MTDEQLIKSLKRSLKGAGFKIEKLQEEIEILKAESKSNEPMYSKEFIDVQHSNILGTIHEQKQVAFKLGEQKGKRSINFNHCMIAWFIGSICGIVVLHLVKIGVI